MDGGTTCSDDIDEHVLLPNQAAWCYDDSKLKVCEKGRQEGYTWATACESVMVASTRKGDGGMDVYFMTTSQDDARVFISECALWVERLSPIMRVCPDVEEYDWIDEVTELGLSIDAAGDLLDAATEGRP